MTVMNNELGNRLDGLKMAIEALPWNPQYSTEANAFNMMMERLDRIKEDFGLISQYDAHINAWNQVKDNWNTRCKVCKYWTATETDGCCQECTPNRTVRA